MYIEIINCGTLAINFDYIGIYVQIKRQFYTHNWKIKYPKIIITKIHKCDDSIKRKFHKSV